MKFKTHVIHNGKSFDLGAECPKDLEQTMAAQGLLVIEKVEAKKADKKVKEHHDESAVE